MTFAEELRNAVTHEPSKWVPPPVPPEEGATGATKDQIAQHIADMALWVLKVRLQPRETSIRVLEFLQALPEIVVTGAGKGLYERDTWTRIGLQGASREEQWVALVRRRDRSFTQTAVWIDGSYIRIVQRESPRVAFSLFTLGATPTNDQLLEVFRAMYDVGIERFYSYIRKDHPLLQVAPAVTVIEPCPFDPDSVGTVYPVDARKERP